MTKNSHYSGALEQEAGIEWQQPEELPRELYPVPRFDLDLLPPPLRPFVLDISERIQCPIEFAAGAIIIAAAAATGRRCGIRPLSRDDYTVVPNLWGMIVAPPGSKKSAPVRKSLAPYLRFDSEAMEEYSRDRLKHEARQTTFKAKAAELQKRIREVVQQGGNPADIEQELADLIAANQPPHPCRYVVSDITIEKLAELMTHAKFGLMLYRDELNGLLCNFSKEGREQDRSFFLEAWNGNGRFVYDRIKRGTGVIEAACVSLVGTIQPGPLTEYVQSAVADNLKSDGLMQRFQILLYPDRLKEWRNVDRAPDLKAENDVEHIFHQLVGLKEPPPNLSTGKNGMPYLHFAPDAQQRYYEWKEALQRSLSDPDEHEAIVAHLSKYESLMSSLALVFHLIDWASDPSGRTELGPVSLEAAERAIAWCRFLLPHARRVYGLAASSDDGPVHLLAKKLKADRLKPGFTARDVYKRRWTGLNDKEVVTSTLDELVELGWLVRIKTNARGRPRLCHFINPAIKQVDS